MDRYQEVAFQYPKVRCSSLDLEVCSTHKSVAKSQRMPSNSTGMMAFLSEVHWNDHVVSPRFGVVLVRLSSCGMLFPRLLAMLPIVFALSAQKLLVSSVCLPTT